YFTVLDLKDAFFCIPVYEQSQTFFAFKWENPTTGQKMQLCWTVLPQGFKNSPTLFGNELAKELEQWHSKYNTMTLLQYVDDLTSKNRTETRSKAVTISLLNFLGLTGYRVSPKKKKKNKTTKNTNLHKQTKKEPFILDLKGERKFGVERKEAICQIAPPLNQRELRGFLEMARWCRLWIPHLGLIPKTSYKAVKGPTELLEWTPESQKGFDEIKIALMSAPALGLPNGMKPFEVCVHERGHQA
ncbi:hypothetical protein N338_00753, partial [Podiceps cristatus]